MSSFNRYYTPLNCLEKVGYGHAKNSLGLSFLVNFKTSYFAALSTKKKLLIYELI